jgi:hypothetical protein
MNLRKRSVQQNLKEISDDSDDSQKITEKQLRLIFFQNKKNGNETPNDPKQKI